MKKIWKFIVKKRIYIVILFFAVILALCGLALKAYLYPEDENTNYGTRLDGIEEVPIDSTKKDNIVSYIKSNEKNTSATVRVQGKIVNISIITTTTDQTKEVIQKLSKEILDMFDEDEKEFYDFQFFITNKDANYYMIGSKSKKNEDITWVFDAIVSEEEVNEEE